MQGLQLWIKSDASLEDKTPPTPVVAFIGQQVDALPAPTRHDLIKAMLEALSKLDSIIDQARGPEPEYKLTSVYEDWSGYEPTLPSNYGQFEKFGGLTGEAMTAVWQEWSRKGTEWKKSWFWSLVAVGKVLENPGQASRKSDLAMKRKAQLNEALAVYPKRVGRSLTSIDAQGLECLTSYLLCEEDGSATGLRDKVLTETLRQVYDHPEARGLLDTLLAYKASANEATIDLVSTKNNRARAKIHELVRDVGGLYSQSREERRAYVSKYDKGPQKTIVVAKHPFDEGEEEQ